MQNMIELKEAEEKVIAQQQANKTNKQEGGNNE